MKIEEARARLLEVKQEMEHLENEVDRSIYNDVYRSELNVKLAEVTHEKIKLEKFIADYVP